jgi:hypothetical protein
VGQQCTGGRARPSGVDSAPPGAGPLTPVRTIVTG